MSDVAAKYRSNYGLGDEIGLHHVQAHQDLEARLTRELLASTPASRWQVFDAAYTELYSSLPWLNETESLGVDNLDAWLKLLPNRCDVFEVGSGKAVLLGELVARGHKCVATEITRERGEKHLSEASGLEWHVTDGIHLASFEREASYDVVISTQVLEHFHPDDVGAHFKNALEILRPGGCYVFDTPHRSAGPHDLSRVFDMDEAQYMHLKEYTYAELGEKLSNAGFRKIEAVIYRGKLMAHSSLAFRAFQLIDKLEAKLISEAKTRRQFRRVVAKLGVPRNIWIAAYK